MTEKLMLSILKYLKKRKESIIVDLIIKDYNKSNFYIALVFNFKIEKFKVLFIPLDVVDNNIAEYVCYQFINITLVNYILETIHNAKDRYKESNVRDKTNKNISTYYIEINTHIGNDDYTFKTTKYIPKEWIYFYEVILILFEHIPTVMNGLCCEILSVLDNKEDMIEYQKSLDFDIFKDDIEKEFGSFKLLDVSYLEKINGLYFAIVDNELVIAQYVNEKKILNLYCTNKDCNKYFYSFLIAVRINGFKKFYKLMVVEDIKDFDESSTLAKYYLCYGVRNDCFKIIEGSECSLLPISKYREGLVKIIGDNNENLKKLIEDI